MKLRAQARELVKRLVNTIIALNRMSSIVEYKVQSMTTKINTS